MRTVVGPSVLTKGNKGLGILTQLIDSLNKPLKEGRIIHNRDVLILEIVNKHYQVSEGRLRRYPTGLTRLALVLDNGIQIL